MDAPKVCYFTYYTAISDAFSGISVLFNFLLFVLLPLSYFLLLLCILVPILTLFYWKAIYH